MSQISTEIGKQIRTFRKKRKMTLEALAAVICKSKSTVSKYESKGQILRSTPNTAPLICGAYNTQPEGLSTMA